MRFKLIDARNRHQLTQKQLAQRLGVVQTTYQRYESGDSMIPAVAAQALIALLGITLDDCLLDEAPKAIAPEAPKAE